MPVKQIIHLVTHVQRAASKNILSVQLWFRRCHRNVSFSSSCICNESKLAPELGPELLHGLFCTLNTSAADAPTTSPLSPSLPPSLLLSVSAASNGCLHGRCSLLRSAQLLSAGDWRGNKCKLWQDGDLRRKMPPTGGKTELTDTDERWTKRQTDWEIESREYDGNSEGGKAADEDVTHVI